mmetsp:Transcript_6950/g.7629  ORF Transcript_6950/g.7629 Transcript_6950/m.7629 type:complete len:292 (+) Transcript_6950:507-1382(+)
MDGTPSSCRRDCHVYLLYVSVDFEREGALGAIFVRDDFSTIPVRNRMGSSIFVTYVDNNTYAELRNTSSVSFLKPDRNFIRGYEAYVECQLAFVIFYSVSYFLLSVLSFIATIKHIWKHTLHQTKRSQGGDIRILTAALAGIFLFSFLRFLKVAIDYQSHQKILRKNATRTLSVTTDAMLASSFVLLVTYWGQLASFTSKFWNPRRVLYTSITCLCIYYFLFIIVNVFREQLGDFNGDISYGLLLNSIVTLLIIVMYIGLGIKLLIEINSLRSRQAKGVGLKPSELLIRVR